MKRILSLALILIMAFSLASCSLRESDIYGTWYKDLYGERNAIQFSKNDDGRSVFSWVVYDIEKDSVISNTKGYFNISDDTLVLSNSEGNQTMALKIKLCGDILTLSSDTVSLQLERFELDD